MRSAAANIALEELHDVCLFRIGVGSQQSDAAHDHSGRAVRALECTCIQECLLHGMQLAVFFESFNGSDRFYRRSADRDLARASWRSADQYGASAALSFSAAILGAGEAKFIAQYIQKWRVGRVGNCVSFAVHFQLHGLRHTSSSPLNFPPDQDLWQVSQTVLA